MTAVYHFLIGFAFFAFFTVPATALILLGAAILEGITAEAALASLAVTLGICALASLCLPARVFERP